MISRYSSVRRLHSRRDELQQLHNHHLSGNIHPNTHLEHVAAALHTVLAASQPCIKQIIPLLATLNQEATLSMRSAPYATMQARVTIWTHSQVPAALEAANTCNFATGMSMCSSTIVVSDNWCQKHSCKSSGLLLEISKAIICTSSHSLFWWWQRCVGWCVHVGELMACV